MKQEIDIQAHTIENLLANGCLGVVVSVTELRKGMHLVTLDIGSRNPALSPDKRGAVFVKHKTTSPGWNRGDLIYKETNKEGEITRAVLVAKYANIPYCYIDRNTICGIFKNWGALRTNRPGSAMETSLLDHTPKIEI